MARKRKKLSVPRAAREYVPNEVHRGARIVSAVLALVLLAWGGIGLWRNELDIGRRRSVILTDSSLWLMVAAVTCGALIFISIIIDHYDRRSNERLYKAFRWTVLRLGWALFVAALIMQLYQWLAR